MKLIGYLLIVAGFLAGAFVAVEQTVAVAWPRYLVVLGAGVAGLVLVRVALFRASRQEEHLTGNLRTLRERLARLVENAEALDRDKTTIDVYDLRHHVDGKFRDDLEAFADARESLAHRFGLQTYAEVMTHFAAGERHLNRVWSASTDGYIDEAHAYVEKAREQLGEALARLRALAPAS